MQQEPDRLVVSICDAREECVATLYLEADRGLRVEGEFPGGLTCQDLESLGFVYYETDNRGELVARLKEVPPSNSLDYLRALLDALPPGYHIGQVRSRAIEKERRVRRERFEAEISLLDSEASD